MYVVVLGSVILTKLLHPLKAELSIPTNLLENSTVFKLKHCSKAPFGITNRFSDNFTEATLEHYAKHVFVFL